MSQPSAGATAGPILFVSHDAWRTGAPTVLLHFLRWLKSNTEIPFAVLLRDGAGDLRNDFESLAEVATWEDVAHGQSRSARIGLFGPRRRSERDRVLALLGGRRPSLIYCNTITNGAVLEALAWTGAPAITHVHELEFWIRERIDPVDLARTKARTNQFIASSKAVEAALVTLVGVPARSVSLVYEFVAGAPMKDDGAAERLKVELGIPPQAPVVGGIGTTDWRKGVDLFVQLAALMIRQRRDVPVHFVWVGGDRTGRTAAELLYDARKAGVAGRVHLCGKTPSIWPYLQMFDLVALVSREDPYPLAMLESGQAERPVVCFEDAGGAPEFVRQDAGMAVPYLDLRAMADATWRLIEQPSLRTALGRTAAQRVRERHMVEQAGPELLRIMRHVGVSGETR